ncbi:TolC family protein [Massilia sp. TSP1-1-2]|uniref:TolC family protein n=1 Tax=Massilia sp. TSP1-1-2 TaxID=2804649 RepID=UPI003CF9018F
MNKLRGHALTLLATMLLSAGARAGDASAQGASAVDYAQALHQLRQVSGAVNGADLDWQAKKLQASALRGIAGPDLRVSGFLGRVSATLSVDTSSIAQRANPLLDSLPPLPGLNLPDIPNAISANRIVDLRSLGLTSVWPLYTGGRLQAVQDIAAGRAAEAGASVQAAEDDTAAILAQRYFTVQLAREAWRLRAAAVDAIKDHQLVAVKMERSGLIAKIDRLKADVAVDNAAREAAKSRSDLEIAQLALSRLLGARVTVHPVTPLFVHSAPVGSLASFVEAAMSSNVAWKQIDSKRAQAAGAVALQGSEFSPTVIALANYNLNRGDSVARANWLVGMSVSVPLVERIDRARMGAAARLEKQRVEVMADQAARDIPTLAESQWRAMEDARLRYLSMASAIALAQESLRLSQVAFKNGQATSIDVADASLGYTKSRLERAQAAYDYVLALARLLGTTGQPGKLLDYSRTASNIVELTKD